MISGLLQASFALPALGGLAAFFGTGEHQSRIPYTLFTLGGLAALGAALLSLWAPETAGALGSLPAFFYALLGAGVSLSALFGIAYVRRYPTTYGLSWFAAAYAVFVIGMEAVVTAQGVFAFLLGWEAMSVAAYALILADGTEESRKAGLIYLVMTQLGFAAIASGMLVLAGGNAQASWVDLAGNARRLGDGARLWALLLLFVGFGSKAGLVPLHQWLPYAHPQAPSHVSALLSGVMLKVALFGFIEMALLSGGVPLSLALVVIAVGMVSAFFGALHAAVEDDAKRLLAWSSIENMGLMFAAFGGALALGALPPSPYAEPLATGLLLFVFFHAVNHFLFKTSLFLAVGAAVSATHTRDLDVLGGLAKKWPVFAGIFLALALGAAALPPLGSFFGEWALLQTLALGFFAPLPIAALSAVALGILGLTAGLALFASAKLFGSMFLGRARSEAAEHAEPLPLLLVLPPGIGAVLLVLSGPILMPLIGRAVTPGSHMGATLALSPGMEMNPLAVLALLALALGFATLVRKVVRRQLAVRVTGTWDCGAPLTARMEQTATGFGASIRFFFRSLVLSEQRLVATRVTETNPWITKKELAWSVGSFFERRVSDPLVALVFRIAKRVRYLQGGVIQMYLFLMLLTLILVLSLSL